MEKSRILTISDKLRAFILQHQIENSFSKFDFILARKRGGSSVTQQSIDSKMKLDCEAAGIERNKAHCHTWRHTRAIQLLDSGMNLVQLQKFLGHSSIQSTLVYLKYSDYHLNQAIREGNRAIELI